MSQLAISHKSSNINMLSRNRNRKNCITSQQHNRKCYDFFREMVGFVVISVKVVNNVRGSLHLAH